MVAEASEGVLKSDMEKDADFVSDPTSLPEERKGRSYRFVSRLIRIARLVGWGVGGTAGAIIGTGAVLEAITKIQASPIFQQALSAALRFIGF